MKRILFLLVLTLVPTLWGQSKQERIENLADAISRAEGFKVHGSIPQRYRNPGDLKSPRGVKLPGQVGIGRGGHTIFKTNRDGWNALMNQLEMVMDDRSRVYTPDMTFNQIGRRYAKNWRLWSRNVTRILGVTGNTTLADYIGPDDPPKLELVVLRSCAHIDTEVVPPAPDTSGLSARTFIR